jgi:DNA-directed RNA polymerase subunit K/omega
MEALSLLPEIQGSTVDSRSRLVIIAAQRARQLMQGATPSVIT